MTDARLALDKGLEMRDAWQKYWQDAASQSAVTTQAGRAALTVFWTEWLGRTIKRDNAKVLDLACGHGVVSKIVRDLSPTSHLFCLDIAPAAVSHVRAQLGRERVYPIVGDACDTPLETASFDIVLSQFGVEYASLDALKRAANLIAPDGALAIICHMKDGAIAKECANNLGVLEQLIASGVFGAMRSVFDPDIAFNEAALRQAVQNVYGVLSQSKGGSAAQYADRLIKDMGQLFERRNAYAPKDAIAWLDQQESAAQAFAGRMQSMLGAALDTGQMEEVCDVYTGAGLHNVELIPMSLGQEAEHAAWCLSAQRAV